MPASDAKQFVISREFDAPRPLVFSCLTRVEHLRHWWGPKGFVVVKLEMDLRPGGIQHYALRGPDGAIMWGKFVYREIVAPQRIVLIDSFSDAADNTTHHPMSPTWPLEMLSTFLFDEVEKTRTKLTVKWSPHNSDETGRATFAAGHASMKQGWTGTLDQLATYLAKA